MSPNSGNTKTPHQDNLKSTSNGKLAPTFKPLPEKKFETRDSLIISLVDNISHIDAVQNLFYCTIICLFTSVLANDYLVKGEVTLGFSLIKAAFGKLYIALFYWFVLFVSTCFVHVIFRFWAEVRLKLIPNYQAVKLWDRLWIVLVAGFYFMAFRVSSAITEIYDLPMASSSIVLLEQVRLTMKIHAYIRHNAAKVINYKPHSDQTLDMPKFKNYLYFLFAPTIVYRDEYPRTKIIRWRFIAARLVEAVGVLIYQSFIFHRFIFPAYEDFGLRKYKWSEVIIPIVEHSLPGLLILMSGFYQVLHCIQNIFAELLRFGDRQFYKDWWNCTDLGGYFKTWNGVIYDWLYTYIYRDVYILTKGNKTLSKLAVFIASGLVHEWVLTYIFKFFYAVIIFVYMSTVVISLFKTPKCKLTNVIFWYGFSFGTSLTISLYTLEYFARANNPDTEYSYKYLFVPRWYRTWNTVIYDWLYTYIYRDVYALTKGNKGLTRLAVFLTSGIVHEWVLTYQFKFYYPVILQVYLVSALLSLFRLPKCKLMNIMFWYGVALGSGMMISLYTLEHFARTNNPDTAYSYKYLFVPRWYTCDCIIN